MAERVVASGMGRPPLLVGTHGRIDFTTQGQEESGLEPGSAAPMANCGAITRWAGSEAEAGTRLTVPVREQASHGDGVMAVDTRLTSATPIWLSESERSDLAASTRQLYQAAARLYVVPTLGSLCIGEFTVAVIVRWPRSAPGTGRNPPGPRGGHCQVYATAPCATAHCRSTRCATHVRLPVHANGFGPLPSARRPT